MNIKSLQQNIHSIVAVTNAELEILANYFEYLSIKKKDKIAIEGRYSDKLYFIEQGLLFSYKTLTDGSTQVIQFAKEGYWIADLYSFYSGATALFSIQAIEDSGLWVIDKQKFEAICKSLLVMETFFRLRFQNAYINTLLRLSDTYSQDADEKYQKIVNENPDLLQRVPQYLIASYLGILPSSLSRIRNKK